MALTAAGLPVPAILHETQAQTQALFEADFHSGFEALLEVDVHGADMNEYMAQATPPRFRACVRDRAMWINASHHARQAGRTSPAEPTCAVR